MIEIKSLMKSFGNERVLFSDFNLKIETGEFIVFVGKSGSGKTTLLNMIGSLEKFDSGKIIVDGVNIGLRKNQLKYLRFKVGFLFQNFALVEDKTVVRKSANGRRQISWQNKNKRRAFRAWAFRFTRQKGLYPVRRGAAKGRARKTHNQRVRLSFS